ncbi:MOSC domain-containing protein [Flavobacterium quisquiliarum]|uniref:MOSC domain-containing protein n=1 Tax=Flavobacterium quisquiliarum TaxID=1834436 RepID=A0ABV8W4E4_9FLAO|nr:MOSC N-terminal beta barrel domain-containing protein [Flavobacterium quisquiliarum]MBW1654482.1 MOSC domain-containing protein [Flavobacterium quisquiliarum]NWL01085.1 sulfurase [Flavobacterium collinsii]
MGTIHIVTEIYIYPIKSLAGISLSSAKAEEMGFENDRRWMLIDAENQMLTQREHRIMSQFYPQISDGKINITFEGQKHEFSIDEHFGNTLKVNVWDDQSEVVEVNQETSKWFSQHLGFECKLVKILKNGARKHESSRLQETFNVSLADGYPYLLIGTESLDFLNEKLEEKITIKRFRPNIVVSTKKAHEEDDFTTFKIGEVQFKNIKPCGRCVMVNNDPENGRLKKEPLKTLSKYRNVDNSVLFGTNIVSLNTGNISVGDTLVF